MRKYLEQYGRVGRGVVLLAFLFGALALSGRAEATEGGGSAYHNGAEDFMTGAVPPPGNYLINYFNYFSADNFKGNDGKTSNPDFKLRVAADVFRFIHVTDKKVLGGFWAMHAFLPLVYQDVTVMPGLEDRRGSLGDIIVDPFIIAWHGANWHAVTGLDIYIPTGNYEKTRLSNVGRNYWTFEPVVAATFLPGAGVDISAKLMYAINTKNDESSTPGATTYLSGQELHMDYAVGKKMGDFTAGLSGYYYKQVTDDEIDGNKVKNIRGQVFAVGPALKYDYKNMSLTFKYMFESEVRNRPLGDNLWLKFLYAF